MRFGGSGKEQSLESRLVVLCHVSQETELISAAHWSVRSWRKVLDNCEALAEL